MNNVVPLRARRSAVPAETTNLPVTPRRATYTVEEVAVILGLGRSSAYGMVRRGEIPAKRMGGRWLIPRQRFHAWLDGELAP